MGNNKTIIIGQKVNPIKVQRAKEFRRNMTPQEQKLWNRLRNNQLKGYHFRRQQVIDGFIIDFYCNPVKLAIEADGEIHKNRQEYDQDRETLLKSKGLRILRVTNEEIENDIESVLHVSYFTVSRKLPARLQRLKITLPLENTALIHFPGEGQGLGWFQVRKKFLNF